MKILETHIVPALQEKIRMQEYAISIFKSISSKSALKKAIKREEVLLDGFPAKTSDWIQEHQKIEIVQADLKQKPIFNLKLEVIFEDSFIAVVNKPAGIPTSGNYFRTIENALPYNLKISPEPDALPYPKPVHRLDNPTSGLLLIAKTRNAQTIMNRAFENKEIHKTYVAMVKGHMSDSVVYMDKIDDKSAESEIRVLRKFTKPQGDFSLVEILPKTGRTHQIRIHLSLNGFPIVGDKKYGGCIECKGGMYLASTKVKFLHPISDELLEIGIQLPKNFQNF